MTSPTISCRRFQSTPPVKAATVPAGTPVYKDGISIHAAREGGDMEEVLDGVDKWISIHAAREGGDPAGSSLPDRFTISIHAAREGGDAVRMESV